MDCSRNSERHGEKFLPVSTLKDLGLNFVPQHLVTLCKLLAQALFPKLHK